MQAEVTMLQPVIFIIRWNETYSRTNCLQQNLAVSRIFLIFANGVVSPHKNESITNNHRTMRKLLLLILTLFIANMAVMAGRVSEAEALQKAQVYARQEV